MFLVCTSQIALALVSFLFLVGFEVAVPAPLRKRVSRTLCDLNCPHFFPEMLVKLSSSSGARGHFVSLIEVSMRQIDHFPVPLSLSFKASLSAIFLLW